MSKSTRLKFVCNSRADDQNRGESAVYLEAVTDGKSEENKSFWDLTPAGLLNFQTINKEAAEMFEAGKEYYIEIKPAED